MRVLECLQNLKSVQPDIHLVQLVVQLLSLDVRNVFENKTGGLCCWVPQNIVQLYYVGTSVQSLQDFGFPVDLFSAYWLENLNDAGLVVGHVHTLENLRVLATTEFLLNLVRVHLRPSDVVFVVERVILGSLGADTFEGSLKSVSALHYFKC